MRRLLAALAVAASLESLGTSRAAEPVKPEPLPPPRIVEPALPSGPPIYVYPRVSRYEVWQNFGVSRTGHWRPLVISGPYGAYYRYNLEPFPWTITHSYSIMPRVVASPPPVPSWPTGSPHGPR
jgi:hypothetical protein